MNQQQTSTGFAYAGFWVRAWATIIDTILLTIIIFPILIAVYGAAYFELDRLMERLIQGQSLVGPAGVVALYVFPAIAAVLFWVYRSATPGKMAISARIVDADTGQKPSTGQFIGRYFAYLVSLLPLGLGFIWVAFDARKQAWHDKLAGTVVVRPAREGSASFNRSA